MGLIRVWGSSGQLQLHGIHYNLAYSKPSKSRRRKMNIRRVPPPPAAVYSLCWFIEESTMCIPAFSIRPDTTKALTLHSYIALYY
ncbi:unnamed protein product, partial [Laminaria digitata]